MATELIERMNLIIKVGYRYFERINREKELNYKIVVPSKQELSKILKYPIDKKLLIVQEIKHQYQSLFLLPLSANLRHDYTNLVRLFESFVADILSRFSPASSN